MLIASALLQMGVFLFGGDDIFHKSFNFREILMPKFSEFFSIGLSQHALDFVDINTDFDTNVYVDPYAIEIRNDVWSVRASEYLRTFFLEVLDSLRQNKNERAEHLMSHLSEPRETYLGVSKGNPKGKGVGKKQARELIKAIENSSAYSTGLLSDFSEMSLYVEGMDRDKISDLTTNIIRELLIEYTQEQCNIFDITTSQYSSPAVWKNDKKEWQSCYVDLPYIEGRPILLIPKCIVRRRLTLDGQEFYNKQLTDFLIEEHKNANSSLVHTITKNKNGVIIEEKKVFKGEVRRQYPKNKSLIASMVSDNPHLLELYKSIAAKNPSLVTHFSEDQLSVTEVCNALINALQKIPYGQDGASEYQKCIVGVFTMLFFPSLIKPTSEWPVHDGRKRIDIVYTNAADAGFFSHRRDGPKTKADLIIVECKNYSKDVSNPEIDQLLGRFSHARGSFGILACRSIQDKASLSARCRDAALGQRGYIIVLTDDDILYMLRAKAEMDDNKIEGLLQLKYRELIN